MYMIRIPYIRPNREPWEGETMPYTVTLEPSPVSSAGISAGYELLRKPSSDRLNVLDLDHGARNPWSVG